MRMVPVIVAVCLPGIGAFAGCWVASGSALCCGAWARPCSGAGQEWSCPQDPVPGTGGPFVVATASSAGAGAGGWNKLSSTPVGTCQMIYRNCGAMPNECVYTSISTVTCVSAAVGGASCVGGSQ